jgi:uncharacterized protein
VITPVFVAEGKPLDEWIKPVSGAPGHFRTASAGREPNAEGNAHEVDLVPFYQLHDRTYSTYWDLMTPDQWAAQKAEYVREAAHERKLDAATVALVKPTMDTSEHQLNYQAGNGVTAAYVAGRIGRAGRSWFSYDLPVESAHPMVVIVTYYSADRRTSPASFDILADGERIGEQKVELTDPGHFYDVTYPVPPTLLNGKSKVTLRFQAKERSQIAAVFAVRMVRGDELD